ncbi:hypothetical protein [Streptomyces sp. NPDC048172]|uniref:hypothetical protein n=1 Tax=Streptomyces sp. NPDC048172 TaxID=3365505 RepID=UPI00371FFCB1
MPSAHDRAHEHADVPTWPLYDLTVHEDGRIVVSGPLIPQAGHPTRAAAVDTVAGAAARLGRPVRATAVEPDGNVWQLIITPDGEVREASAPVPVPVPAPVPAPKKSQGKGGVREEPEPFEAQLKQVEEQLAAGRAERAAELAAGLDERAAGVLGLSHPDALRIREVCADAAAAAGDVIGGIRLYRDVAERWYYRGDGERAEEVARRAEALWKRISRVDLALSAGVAVIRMRNQLPGRSGEALAMVLEHWAWLESRASAASEPDRAARGVAEVPAPPQEPRPLSTWERPAVHAVKSEV